MKKNTNVHKNKESLSKATPYIIIDNYLFNKSFKTLCPVTESGETKPHV